MKYLIATLLALSTLLSLRAHADQVRFLPRGDQALAARLDLIKNAQKTIFFSYYEFFPCEQSMRVIMDALVERAKAGVKVEGIIDAGPLDETTRASLAMWFKQRNVKILYYNIAHVDLIAKNQRSHIKFIVADGRRFIAGGRNAGDAYFDLSAGDNYVDADVDVVGKSAQQVEAFYHELYETPQVKSESSRKVDLAGFQANCLRPQAKVKAIAEYFAAKSQDILSALPVRSCSQVTFQADTPAFLELDFHPGISEDAAKEYMDALRLRKKRATQAVLSFYDNTTEKLSLMNWTYIPTMRIDHALIEARKRGVHINVITNHAAGAGGAFDKAFDVAARFYIRRDNVRKEQRTLAMRDYGALAQPWELTPKGTPWRIHAKTGVSDGKHVLVSSFNIDPRSYAINLEAAVTVRNCPELAEDVTDQMKTVYAAYRADVEKYGRLKEEEPGFWDSFLATFSEQFL